MTSLNSGHRVEKIKGEEAERLKESHFLYSNGAIRLYPGGWIFPSTYEKYEHLTYNFKVKPTDILVTAISKSGINWVQEIVWNLVHNPDLDNSEANMTIDARCPFFDTDHRYAIPGFPSFDPNGELIKKVNQLCSGRKVPEGIFACFAAAVPEPRLIKAHLPCCFLPPDVFKISKVVYVARDPRDVMVSWYHFSKLHIVASFNGSFADLVDDYINGRNLYGPYWEHVRIAWEKRNDPNFLFLFYEDLKKNPEYEIRKIDKFLGTNRTKNQIDNIVHFTNFFQMKERTKDNPPTATFFHKEAKKNGGSYFRSGTVGSWKEDFTPELQEKVNFWMTKNLTKFGNDFRYKV